MFNLINNYNLYYRVHSIMNKLQVEVKLTISLEGDSRTRSNENVRQENRQAQRSPSSVRSTHSQQRGQRGGNGNRDIKRTPENMGIRVGDEVVMTKRETTWRVQCRNNLGVGEFRIISASNPEFVGRVYDKGSPLNSIYQDMIESMGLQRQKNGNPWANGKHYRDGVVVGSGKLDILPQFRVVVYDF